MLDGDLLRLGLAADERGERDAHLVVHRRRLVDVIGTDEEFRQEGAGRKYVNVTACVLLLS